MKKFIRKLIGIAVAFLFADLVIAFILFGITYSENSNYLRCMILVIPVLLLFAVFLLILFLVIGFVHYCFSDYEKSFIDYLKL